MKLFVSSIGRSGSRFLSELFSTVTDMPSFHIPKPQCKGQVFWDANNRIDHPELEKKVKAIGKKSKNGDYFESNPLFIRCFAEKVLDHFTDVGVLHVLRNPLEVARSYTNRNSFPDMEKRNWRPRTDMIRKSIDITELALSGYQKNLWDWLDNELRYHALKNRFAKAYTYHFENYSRADCLQEMFDFFGVSYHLNKLQTAIDKNKLFKGDNVTYGYGETVISDDDLKEAKDFIDQLKGIPFDKAVFDDPMYQRYDFFKWAHSVWTGAA